MIFLIAKRLAYEDQVADNPGLTGKELRTRFGYTKVDLMLFLDEAPRVKPSYRIGLGRFRKRGISYGSLDETKFTVETQNLDDITEWTLEEQQFSEHYQSADFNFALAALQEAMEFYEEAEEIKAADDHRSPEKKYELVKDKIKTACSDVKQYPVDVEYDYRWETFSKYAEALFDYLEEDIPIKTTHCVPRMERALQTMKKEAETEYRF